MKMGTKSNLFTRFVKIAGFRVVFPKVECSAFSKKSIVSISSDTDTIA